MAYETAPNGAGDPYGSTKSPTGISAHLSVPTAAPTTDAPPAPREFPAPPSRTRGRSPSRSRSPSRGRIDRSRSPVGSRAGGAAPGAERSRGAGGGGRSRSRSVSRAYVGGGGGRDGGSWRDRERSPYRGAGGGGGDREWERRAPPPPQVRRQPPVPTPSATLGVFGLSIRTREPDLDEEFARWGTVESVTIVYDQRTDRSRGFGFIRMGSVDQAAMCIEKLNNFELHGRRLRVDYSTTKRPHDPTPGAYMGIKRDDDRPPPRDFGRDRYSGSGGGGGYGGYSGGGGGGGGRYDDHRGGGRDRDYDYRRRDDNYYDPYYRRSPPRRRDDYDYGRMSDRGRYHSPSPPRDRDPRAGRAPAYEDAPPAPAAEDLMRY